MFVVIPQVNNNGGISFIEQVSAYTPEPFPLERLLPLIAVYWADVDTSSLTASGNTVWYRETADPSLLERAKIEITKAFLGYENFVPTYLVIATWDHVGYFSRHTDKVRLTN